MQTILNKKQGNAPQARVARHWCKAAVLAVALPLCQGGIAPAQPNPSQASTHLERARDAIAAHHLDDASREYAEILKLDPHNVEASTGLGVSLYGLGKPQDAEAALQSALLLDPDQTTAQVFLALSKAALGQCVDAIPLLKKNFGESTESKLHRIEGLTLVTCYENQSDLDHARDTAQALNQMYPDDPDVLFHLAEVYSGLLNTTVNQLLAKHPESYRFHQIAGETLEAESNRPQAIKEYRKALEINPKASSLHYRIGRLTLLTSGGTETVGGTQADAQALTEFQKELAINPADEASEYQIGEICYRGQRYQEAKQHFLRAIELSPDFAEAHAGLAKVELGDHQPSLALKELEHAIKLQPNNASAHYTLMLVYRDLGQTQQATSEMELFRNLKTEEDKDFRAKLHSLLADGQSTPEKSR